MKTERRQLAKPARVCNLVLALAYANLAAAADRPSIKSRELAGVPVLDGVVLGDPAWSGLVPATGFQQIQPDEGLPATQKTEVYIGYSGDALFIGVVAYDTDPSGILATDSRRDSELGDTDSFQMVIDGMRDGQNGFVFGTNPAGIQ
jgi:hypothetical protein